MAKTKRTDEEEEKEDLTGDGTMAVNDAWTGMLAVSLMALGIASALLAWDYFKYDGGPTKSDLIGSAPKLPPVDKKATDGAAADKDKDKDKGAKKGGL